MLEVLLPVSNRLLQCTMARSRFQTRACAGWLAAFLLTAGVMAATLGCAAQATEGSSKPGSVTNGSGATPPLKATAVAPAQTATNGADAGTGSPAVEVTTSMPLKITLTPSETPLKIGSTSNIAATILNTSSKPVLVKLDSMQLRTHSIVAASTSRCVLAMTPNYNMSYGGDVILQPQDQVSVLFNLSEGAAKIDDPSDIQAPPAGTGVAGTQAPAPITKKMLADMKAECDAGSFGGIKRALDFSPGNYDYFLSGYFSLCIFQGDAACNLPMRQFSLDATFPVGIDQTSIIIFAMVGGWLAYLVVIFNDTGKKHGSMAAKFSRLSARGGGWRGFLDTLVSWEGFHVAWQFALRMIGVAILSAAFTIVSSRLSDTQLPVKITILDAWGAMTIGFVSYFIGQKFILTLTNWGSVGSSSNSGTDKTAAGK